MKKYEANILPDHFGAGLGIEFPNSNLPVLISQDVYGEVESFCQVLVHEPDQEEPALAIRFNDDGTIAEISMSKKYRALVVDAEAPTATPWMIRRDGV